MHGCLVNSFHSHRSIQDLPNVLLSWPISHLLPQFILTDIDVSAFLEWLVPCIVAAALPTVAIMSIPRSIVRENWKWQREWFMGWSDTRPLDKNFLRIP